MNNGDGFSFVAKDGSVTGFRADICEGPVIRSKPVQALFVGARIFRNINAAFEKELEKQACSRIISATTDLKISKIEGIWKVFTHTVSEDGRCVDLEFAAGDQEANNIERMTAMIHTQMEKTYSGYRFSIGHIAADAGLPFMSASSLNGIRREIAETLDTLPCGKKDILLRDLKKTPKTAPQKDVTYKANVANRLAEKLYQDAGTETVSPAYELSHQKDAELMRSKYCIRYELGMCPVHHKVKDSGTLFLLNNGQSFALKFDCRNCEMTVLNTL